MVNINVANEKEFHNKIFESGIREESLGTLYSYTLFIDDYFNKFLQATIKENDTVLEYGCGMNTKINWLAAKTNNRFSFDISDFAIENHNKEAQKKGYPTQYVVADAHELPYENETFDVVFGTAILHHLDLSVAIAELSRVTKQNGIVVFVEPLGHNYFINKFRNKTPELRTVDEHPLMKSDLETFEKHFSLHRTKYYFLLPLFVYAIFKSKTPKFLLNIFINLDRVVFFLFPFIRKYAWTVLIVGKKR